MKYLFVMLVGIILHQASFAQGCVENYVEPSFQLQKTDPGCQPGTGSIQASNVDGGVAPYTYRLVEANITNNSGTFSGLTPGLYTVELRDACGTVRTRQVTLVQWSFSFSYNVLNNGNCSDGTVTFTTSPISGQFTYGVVKNGDTTWSSTPQIDIKLYKTLTILVKDDCGNVQAKSWHAPHNWLPYIDALQYRLQCDKFDLFPVYYGFDDPEVCLYEKGTNKLIECKTGPGAYTGGHLTNFFDIPWGEYYVIVSDKCYRDSMYHPDMRSAGGSELNPYNWDCTTFTMHVDGMEDTVCLYNAVTNQLISCKGQDTVSINPRTGVPWPSGAVWENLPYGSYYAWIYDPCEDSTFKIDSTVVYPFSPFMSAFPGCSSNQTTLQANFSPESKKPFTINVYNPNGLLNNTFVSNVFDNYIGVSLDTASTGPLKVIATDGCGNSDTTFISPQVTTLSKQLSVYNKCPGVSGNSGSGDLSVLATTGSSVQPRPQIIKKNGADVTIDYNYQSKDTFLFANLETGTYIVKYTFTSCSQWTLYDTVEIKDYIYPNHLLDTAIQCGGNPFNFQFPIVGGLTPYTFQIIENTPSWPSLITAPQDSPHFAIGTGQHYTNIKVRAIDRCGNSTIGDVSVQPINGCSVLPVDSLVKNPAIENGVVKVFPNPSKGQFTISVSKRKKTNYKIEVINAAGVEVYKQVLMNVDRKDIVVTERLIPGFYIIHVTDLQTAKKTSFKQIVQ
ncbi:MAG TPA: T9SS type A sorting domain-containing protein [Flavisolibacter sp.]|nr:T9SS type A sorting domain-containing protein [Flavisolibacter sp.]